MRALRRMLSGVFGRTAEAPPRPAAAPEPDRDAEFRLIAENSSDIICRIDADNMPVYVSPSAKQVLGWTPAEMVLAGPNFIHPDDEPMVKAANDQLFAGEVESSRLTFRLQNAEGHPVWVEATARLARNPDGSPNDVVIVMRDISERKRLEDELRALALTDALTGLGNRRAFDEALERDWRRTLRGGGELSLLLLDIDHFKRFNDLYGHQVGDDCLRAVAAAIRAELRSPADTAARYGGEEIAIILPDTNANAAMAVAQSVRAAIEALDMHHAAAANPLRTVTASVGVATAFARTGATVQMPSGLLKAADAALYKAKQNGRNRVEATALLTAREQASGA